MNKITYLILIAGVTLTFGQHEYYEEVINSNVEPFFGQFFGTGISTNGTDLLIAETNAIHFYANSDSGWTEYQMIESPNFNTSFGQQTQIIDDIAFVGAKNDSVGCIYVYNKIDGYWIEDGIITTDDEDIHSFGMFFHFAEEFVVIRANSGSDQDEHGVVYVFQYNGNSWIEHSRIDGIDGGFGVGLYAYNDTIIIGDAGQSINNVEQSGLVHIYELNEINQFEQIGTILPSIPIENSHFGSRICRNDQYLFVSAPRDNNINNSGWVYVYEYDVGEWVENGILSSNDAEPGDWFGYAIDVEDSTLVVTAYKKNDGGPAAGAAYIYQHNSSSGQWQEYNKICPSDLFPGDFFGTFATISDDQVFISSPMKDNMTGVVYVYDPHDNSLHSNFAGNIRSGNGPLTVQFTAVQQGNPTAYEWDFNGDGFVDSTEPNPQFTYQINGVYTVILTVYDETGSDSEVKTDYIQVVSDILFGDVNGDGILDVSDLVIYIDLVLGYSEPEEEQFLAGDVNYSGQIDIIDIVMVIDEILG